MPRSAARMSWVQLLAFTLGNSASSSLPASKATASATICSDDMMRPLAAPVCGSDRTDQTDRQVDVAGGSMRFIRWGCVAP